MERNLYLYCGRDTAFNRKSILQLCLGHATCVRSPLEEDLGAYFPVAVIAHAWLNRKGWKGVVSIEIFDWRMRDESRRPSDNVSRAVESMRKLTSVLESST